MKNSKTMAFGEVEYINPTPIKGSWFARMKVHNLEEAKKVTEEFKEQWKDYNITARYRGRGRWTPKKIRSYYILKALANQPLPRRLPMDMPCSVSDYIMVYYY